MAGNNLKTIVTADTSQFKKEMKGAKDALKDFSKEGDGALSEISSMFGVSSSAISSLANNLSNATKLIVGLGREGDTALAGLKSAAMGVGAALAGMGIAAAINLFKELNAEAAYFEQRMQGVNLAAGAKAARETYRDALIEASGRGEAWAKEWQTQKTVFSRIWSDLRTLNVSPEERQDALSKAYEANRLASERVDIQRRLDASVESQARFQKEINDQLLIARDRSQSSADRKAAEAKAVELINAKYAEQLSIATALRDNAVAAGALTGNTDAETRAIAQANANILNIEAQRTQELTAMVRLENQITTAKASQATSSKETQEATVLTLEAATALVQRQRELAQIAQQNNAMMSVARFNLDGALPRGEGIQGQANAMVIPGIIKPEFDTQEWTDISNEVAGIIEDALTSVGDSVGQLIGDLATGGDAWGNFTNNAIQAFGDMAVTIGKMAVATGMATLGIKAALESLNPYVAIAAGTALIALGAAVRAGMSNVASGNYSTSVASSSYSSTGTYGQTSFGREMEVKVSGTLTANGSQLVAVLNNEKDRKNYTT